MLSHHCSFASLNIWLGACPSQEGIQISDSLRFAVDFRSPLHPHIWFWRVRSSKIWCQFFFFKLSSHSTIAREHGQSASVLQDSINNLLWRMQSLPWEVGRYRIHHSQELLEEDQWAWSSYKRIVWVLTFFFAISFRQTNSSYSRNRSNKINSKIDPSDDKWQFVLRTAK